MSYERLELIDGVTKWDTEKVQHLEDAIIKNESDIQKYHNDSIVEIQADWNQSDETAKNHVQNRTHYKETTTIAIAENLKAEIIDDSFEEAGGFYERTGLNIEDLSSEFMWNYEEMDLNDLKVFNNDQEIRVTDFESNLNRSMTIWHLENGLYVRFYSMYGSHGWSIRLKDCYNMSRLGEKFNLSIYAKDVKYIPLNDKFLSQNVWNEIDKGQKQSDWLCTDENDTSYIKNRTHYDYWAPTDNYIYNYDSVDNRGHLPYIFEVVPDEYDFLSGHGFFYNGLLFNANSDWKMIGEEYDENLDSWKTKYECQQIKHYPYEGNEDEILTMSAITYSQYDVDQGKRKYFVSIDCTFKGNTGGIVLYEAEMCSKTLDKRFLADFTVTKDWSVNDENDPAYIKNKTHYLYKGADTLIYGGRFEFNGDYEEWVRYGSLPYEQIIESDLAENETPGYWLGSMGGYHLSGYESASVDAYSNWEISEVVDDITSYYCSPIEGIAFRVNVQPIEFNKYKVILTSAYTEWGDFGYSVYTLGVKYKKLDDVYLPDTIARKSDLENIECAVTSVNGQTGDVVIDLNEYVTYDYVEKSGWEVLGNNIRQDDENIALKGNVDIDNLHLRLTTPEGHEDIITNESSGLTISRKANGTYVLVYLSGVENNTAVYEFRLKGNIDGSGVAMIPYITLVESATALTVESYSEAVKVPQINESLIPDTIARKSDLENIECAVTSVNGQTGDVIISWSDLGDKIDESLIPDTIARTDDIPEIPSINYPVTSVNGRKGDIRVSEGVKSWNNLDDRPFYERFIPVIPKTYLGASVSLPCYIDHFDNNKQYLVVLGEVNYKGVNKDINGTYHADTLYIYDSNDEQIGWIYIIEDLISGDWEAGTYFKDEGLWWITIEVFDTSDTEIKKLEDKYLSENIIRRADLLVRDSYETTVTLGIGSGSYIIADTQPVIDRNMPIMVHSTVVDHPIRYIWGIGDIDAYYPSGRPDHVLWASDGLPELGWFKSENKFEFNNGDTYLGSGTIVLTQDQIIPVKKLDEKYISEDIARAPKAELDYVTEAPTAEQYNALLDILKQAGILA